MSKFNEKLNCLLSESKKTQKEIASDINITKQKLSNLKSGYSEPNLEDLTVIANYFNVSSDYLLGLENEDFTKNNLSKNTLSAKEERLLQKFNKLDNNKQNLTEYYIDNLLDVQKAENSNKANELLKAIDGLEDYQIAMLLGEIEGMKNTKAGKTSKNFK